MQIVGDYKEYLKSFNIISDELIRKVVDVYSFMEKFKSEPVR